MEKRQTEETSDFQRLLVGDGDIEERSLNDEISTFNGARPPDGDPLSFWSSNKSLYPQLAPLALSILSTPPTSAQTERTFSRLKLLVTDHRTSLSEASVQSLVIASMNDFEDSGQSDDED